MATAPSQVSGSAEPEDVTDRPLEEITLRLFAGAHLGDQLCLTPLPRLLRTVYGTRVFVTNDPPVNLAIFKHNPYVAGFRGGRGLRLDRATQGHGHLIQRLQRMFGLEVGSYPRPEIYLSEEERCWSLQERAKWPQDRSVCLLSTRAITDRAKSQNVDWDAVGRAWMDTCTVVQPIMTKPSVYQGAIAGLPPNLRREWRPEKVVPGAIVYEDLDLRRYMALFAAADYFCGATSGGAQVAAAFGLPSLIVIWRSLLESLRFPLSGWGPAPFLYPQHDFIAAEDLTCGNVDAARLLAGIDRVRRRPCAAVANKAYAAASVRIVSQVDASLLRVAYPRVAPSARTATAAHVRPGALGGQLGSKTSRRLMRTKDGRVICIPVVL